MEFQHQATDEGTPFIPTSDIESTASYQPKAKLSRLKVFQMTVVLLLAAGFGAVAVAVGESLGSRSDAGLRTLSNRKSFGNCGNSPNTARQRSCVFDVITFSWNVPLCHNAALSDEFHLTYGYKYYLDRTGQQEVPYANVTLGERDLWSSWEQHLIHCLYTTRKLHHAYETGLPIDGYVGNINHTRHCATQWIEQLKTPINGTVINSLIRVKYPECWDH